MMQSGHEAEFQNSIELLKCTKQQSLGQRIPSILGPNINYSAPELTKGYFNPKSDIFSLGCVIFSVLK